MELRGTIPLWELTLTLSLSVPPTNIHLAPLCISPWGKKRASSIYGFFHIFLRGLLQFPVCQSAPTCTGGLCTRSLNTTAEQPLSFEAIFFLSFFPPELSVF